MNYEELIISWLETQTGVIGLKLETPKDSSHGDYAFASFILAKQLGKNPVEIAKELAESFSMQGVSAKAIGPYLNFTITDNTAQIDSLKQVLEGSIIKQTAMHSIVLIESPGPNTNKPLHLGHLLNMLLGMSLARALQAIGKKVHTVDVINDRGIHICKSMLAYQLYGEGKTPETEGKKPDHFVGDYYVKFSLAAKESEEKKKELQESAQALLSKWEAGDEEVLALWKRMNQWCYDGWQDTFDVLGMKIEKKYYESETYLGGKEIIYSGVEKGIFTKNENGAIEVDLREKNLDKKILLRSDGTSVYITQDINMAKLRYEEYTFDEMIYVVGNEQAYHFQVLFEVFALLNWPFANKCKHFAYGMVELPSGKMKSREGTVIDADDLINMIKTLCEESLKERYPDLDEKEFHARSQAIAMAAIKFFFLKSDPLKNIVFDPKASLSFEGETGPYVQYTYARIRSILRKNDASHPSFEHLNTEEDKQLLKLLELYQETVERMAEQLKPSALCHYLIKLCQQFNSYYATHQIIQEDKALQADRVALISGVAATIKHGLEILGIEALEVM